MFIGKWGLLNSGKQNNNCLFIKDWKNVAMQNTFQTKIFYPIDLSTLLEYVFLKFSIWNFNFSLG